MGVVYEAFDRERNALVALKTLRNLEPKALYRFKHEFRALADLEHPNLVRLGEMFNDGDSWFFTMELVEGLDFLSWVRGDAPGLTRLRAAIAQLAQGISALHEARKVHRDIKPSNVLVTAEGRLVLLDFGLVADMLRGSQDVKDTETQIVGTAAYMAPEQAASRPVGPEADWYSLGAMLYEALTGDPPFSGPPLEILMNKQRYEPPPPRVREPSVPADLDAICIELLRADPRRRLSGPRALLRLAPEDATGAPPLPAGEPVTQTMPFVGRGPELLALRAAWDASRSVEAHAVTMFVHGESGIGKSALVRTFLEGLEKEAAGGNTGMIVFSARCYERESLPFKAFDGIVDTLSRHLSRMEQVDAALLLPHDAAILARLFPVLRRVPAMSRIAEVKVPNPQELRTRAFSALRELLTRLAERRPLALFIDDFQWADADSLALFGHLMHGPAAPPLFLVATVRTSGGEARIPDVGPLTGDARHLKLAALSLAEARGLVDLLGGVTARAAATIAEEAAGHPLFIHELVRHVASVASDGPAPGTIRLEEALWSRATRLEEPARLLLEVIAVAGEPLLQRVAAEAAGMELAACARWASLLRAAHLVRSTGVRAADAIECYHDRVRESVTSHLDDTTQRRHHAALAHALESTGAAAQDPQVLVRHLEAAGETERAATQAERAARVATEALAFDRASELYRTALRLGKHSPFEERRLRIELGDALVNAGRTAEAAEEFLGAADDGALGRGDAATRLDCRRKAAEHLLGTGQIERGLETLRVVLAEFGETLPATPRRALVSLLYHRARIRLRGLRWQEKDASEISPRDLNLIDIYKAVGVGLGMVDNVRGADFQARGLLMALETGETSRVVRAFGLEAAYVASQGPRANARAMKLAIRTRELANVQKDPYLLAWADAGEGIVNYLGGGFTRAAELLLTAEHTFRNETAGTAWESNTVRIFRGLALRHAGLLAELRRTYDEGVRDAIRRGDRYAEATMTRALNAVWLASDAPADALAELDRRPWIPPAGGYHIQNWYELRARAELDLYRADVTGAARRSREAFDALRRSMLLRVQTIRTEAMWLAGRLALAEAQRDAASPAAAAPLLAQASKRARELDGQKVAYAAVWAALLRAGVAVRRGDQTRAIAHLRAAGRGADTCRLILCSAAAQRLHGQLVAGSEGAAAIARADQRMRDQGIKNPSLMTAVVAPGF